MVLREHKSYLKWWRVLQTLTSIVIDPYVFDDRHYNDSQSRGRHCPPHPQWRDRRVFKRAHDRISSPTPLFRRKSSGVTLILFPQKSFIRRRDKLIATIWSLFVLQTLTVDVPDVKGVFVFGGHRVSSIKTVMDFLSALIGKPNIPSKSDDLHHDRWGI